MAIREALNKNKTAAIAVCIVLAGALIGVRYWTASNEIPAPLTRAYYSDDDGKTYFVDDSAKVCPFDHNGKPAVKAVVFQCGDGKPFVAYLTQFTEKDQQKILQLRALPPNPDNAKTIGSIAENSMQVKRPGDSKWVRMNSAAARDVVNPEPPPGETGDLTSVDP
jgi:hypothetical protein